MSVYFLNKNKNKIKNTAINITYLLQRMKVSKKLNFETPNASPVHLVQKNRQTIVSRYFYFSLWKYKKRLLEKQCEI